MTYREPPPPKPLETWKDRVTMRKIVLPVALLGTFVWAGWLLVFGKPPGVKLFGLELFLHFGGAMCALFWVGWAGAFVIGNWNKPISKWRWWA